MFFVRWLSLRLATEQDMACITFSSTDPYVCFQLGFNVSLEHILANKGTYKILT
jgi:hypothetical protein